MSGYGWIWKTIQEEIRERKSSAKPWRRQEEREQIWRLPNPGTTPDAKQGVMVADDAESTVTANGTPSSYVLLAYRFFIKVEPARDKPSQSLG